MQKQNGISITGSFSMGDPKKIQEYLKLISGLRQQGCDTAAPLLLALLRHYASQPAGHDSPIKKFSLFFSKTAHDRNYQKYIEAKIQELSDLGDNPLNDFITTIDSDISSDAASRAELQISKKHNPNGHFHALWTSFFISYPDLFVANPHESVNSVLFLCHRNASTISLSETYHRYIIYSDGDEDYKRLITVVDSQPYYLSTGSNSGMANTWLPFIMCRGTFYTVDSMFISIPSKFNKEPMKERLSHTYNSQQLLKVVPESLYKTEIDLTDKQIEKINNALKNELISKADEHDIYSDYSFKGRFIRRKDIINSIRFGGGIWGQQKFKNKIHSIIKPNNNEKTKLKLRIILSDTPDFTTANPDQVNKWLIENDAEDIYDLFLAN